jgi:hypothetical protein
MRLARGIFTATAIGAAAALVACAPVEITPAFVTYTESPPTEKTFAPEPPEDPMPAIAWPLTGMDASAATPEQLALPAVSVKVPNDNKARPQTNLEFADVVFEEYVEAGIPRFIAVFHSQIPETVGPIRSMREMDPNIIGSLGGPLVFSGANRSVMDVAKRSGQVLIAQDLGDKGFFRTKDRPSPYNLHIKMADILAQVTDLTAPAPQFSFAYPAEAATATLHGTPATHIDLRFSRYGEPSWDWDAESNTWLRSEFGEPDVTVAGTRLFATNVVVLHVRVYTNFSLPVSEVIVSNAPGYVATGGKYIPILWSKADRTAPYVITTEDGKPVQLAPGNTWVELIPNAGVSGAHANFS